MIARRSRRRRLLSGLAALVLLAGLTAALVWGILTGQGEARHEAAGERPVATPARRAPETSGDGTPILALDAETQRRNDIETLTLRPAPQAMRLAAHGTVRDPAPLTALAGTLAADLANRDAAAARLAASRAAFERARTLYKDQHNVSAAALEAAEATFRADQAAREAAEAALRTQTDGAVQEWGEVLGKDLVESGSLSARLIAGQAFLVEVVLPADAALPPEGAPMVARLAVEPGSAPREARLVSAAPRVDPRLQGAVLFYLAEASSGVLPGMRFAVFLDAAPLADAVVVPADAVVWWQGQAWIYLHTANGFARHPIATDTPRAEGGYIIRNPVPGSATVQLAGRGAQALFSEEFRNRIELGIEGDAP